MTSSILGIKILYFWSGLREGDKGDFKDLIASLLKCLTSLETELGVFLFDPSRVKDEVNAIVFGVILRGVDLGVHELLSDLLSTFSKETGIES